MPTAVPASSTAQASSPSRPGPSSRLYRVNVGGTWRVISVNAWSTTWESLIYVSSVHAIPQKPKGSVITEKCEFSAGLCGRRLRQEQGGGNGAGISVRRQRGLNVRHCLPVRNHRAGRRCRAEASPQWQKPIFAGKLPFAVWGGYDFVDVTGRGKRHSGLRRKRRARQRLHLCPATMPRFAGCFRLRGKGRKSRSIARICLPLGACKAGGSVL